MDAARRLAARAALLAALLAPLPAAATVAGAVAANGAGLARRRIRRRFGAAAREDSPLCTCDCCSVTSRRPDEFANDVQIKCAPSEGHSGDLCGMECRLESNDLVLSAMVPDEISDYLRFCFYECKPAEGPESPVSTQCLALEGPDLRYAVDANGNAVDPAMAYSLPASVSGGGAVAAAASLLSRGISASSRRSIGAQPPPEDAGAAPAPAPLDMMGSTPEVVQAAVESATKGKAQSLAMGADARRAAANLRASEAARSAEGASDPFAAVRDIERAGEASLRSAARSGEVARRALNAMRQARGTSWQAAVAVADREVEKMRRDVATEVEDARPPKKWREYAAQAAAKASKPYLDTVAQAQQSAEQWHLRAREAEAEAERYSSEGNPQEARALRDEAEKMYGTARQAAQSAKDYYALAGEAAARAASTMPFPPAV